MSDAFPITIFHNPACGTSRNALEIIRTAGYEPQVVLYLKTGWTRAGLDDLMQRSGLSARDLLRAKERSALDRGLTSADATDEAILAAMVRDPVLVNRPIVVTPKGVRLCRPAELVRDLLEAEPARSV
jgi:arsenate reductase